MAEEGGRELQGFRGVPGSAVIEAFRRGEPEAVRAVYRDYGRLVYAVARRIVGTPALAEEVTQETFVKAWRAAATFDADRELGPWLATITRRCAIDVLRRESRRPTGQAPATLDEQGASDPRLEDIESGRADDAWVVRQAVDQLPVEERDVVRLQHTGGLTHAEIAERLGVPLGTVKSRSHRAHHRLAAALGHLREG